MPDYPTPHIKATPADFAESLLMPGDPKRSRFIAENFLENAKLVNNVRGVQGYTGTYKGCPVSVMASGMGIPSMGIYSHELYTVFGVENIVRIGSAGAYQENINVHDIVIAEGACTNSNYASQFGLSGTFAPIADFGLLCKAVKCAEEMKLNYHVGNLFSSDIFYDESNADDIVLAWKKMGVMAVEMEAAGLYMNAAKAGKKALAICTISDHLLTGENTTSDERVTGFVNMIKLALNVVTE